MTELSSIPAIKLNQTETLRTVYMRWSRITAKKPGVSEKYDSWIE